MAKQLEQYSPKKVLDIGSGLGHGILALLSTFPSATILGVEENVSCFHKAVGLLKNKGVPVVSKVRGRVIESASGYSTAYEPANSIDVMNGVLLVEADFLSDSDLLAKIRDCGPYDAITVWLPGTHLLRPLEHHIRGRIQHANEYRLKVQNAAYDLAHQVLRLGGVIHIVDRARQPKSPTEHAAIVEGHEDQASTTDLQLRDVAFMQYSETEMGMP
ncbi:MAG TPA: hypothetical protein VEH27_10985, partial [Methylomirabilota bacterium]|nr:hypothetical protein [Methylomirabilota bacterium]